MITLGALAIAFGIIRIFVFKMPESPRYLLSKGQDAEAVAAVNYIARFNGKPETLTLAMLEEIDATLGIAAADPDAKKGLSHRAIVRENLKDYKGANYKHLFATRKFAVHTSLTWLIWLTIGSTPPFSPFSLTNTTAQASPTPSTSASSPPTSRPNSPPSPRSTRPTATTASSRPSASSGPSRRASWWKRASAAAG